MGIMEYSLVFVMQALYHEPWEGATSQLHENANPNPKPSIVSPKLHPLSLKHPKPLR